MAPKRLNKLCVFVVAAAYLTLPLAGNALPEDQLQPIQIKADFSERDEKNGVTTFRGDVTIAQGSLNIAADQVVIYGINNEISKIVATGNPAKLRQQPEADKQIVHAHGDTVEYVVSEERVHLIKNAYVEQEGSTVKGDRIDYDMAKQVVKASSNSANKGRVQMVIPPRQRATDAPTQVPQ